MSTLAVYLTILALPLGGGFLAWLALYLVKRPKGLG